MGKGKDDDKKKKEEVDKKASDAKDKAATAQAEISVQSGLEQVGDKLSKSESKDLKEQGYSLDQINKIANNVEYVKPGAEKKLDKWNSKAEDAKQAAEAYSTSSSSTSTSSTDTSVDDSSSEDSNTTEDSPGISAGGGYGTSDKSGWLAAELNAIDTFRADTTPTLFNSYRPYQSGNLSADLDSAISEADTFISDTASSWKSSSDSSSSSAAVTPEALKPASLLDEEEQKRYGLAF